jgi:hypothetical protein
LSPALMNRAPRFVADLTPVDEARVRGLIPADFFELRSSGPPTRGGDAFQYDIVVDDGSRRHQVTLAEQDIPPSLRAFVQWLQHKGGADPDKEANFP